jgi:hypothetical protein
LTFVLGLLNVPFAMLFVALALLYGILLSQVAVGIETMLLGNYPRLRDRVTLFAAAFLEFIGYHQLMAVDRLVAMFRITPKRGTGSKVRPAAVTAPAESFDPRVHTATPDLRPEDVPERRSRAHG